MEYYKFYRTESQVDKRLVIEVTFMACYLSIKQSTVGKECEKKR